MVGVQAVNPIADRYLDLIWNGDHAIQETEEIKRRADEDLEAHCIPADMDRRKTCSIITKEYEATDRRFYDELCLKNYVHRIDVYNRFERPALEKIIKKERTE